MHINIQNKAICFAVINHYNSTQIGIYEKKKSSFANELGMLLHDMYWCLQVRIYGKKIITFFN